MRWAWSKKISTRSERDESNVKRFQKTVRLTTTKEKKKVLKYEAILKEEERDKTFRRMELSIYEGMDLQDGFQRLKFFEVQEVAEIEIFFEVQEVAAMDN